MKNSIWICGFLLLSIVFIEGLDNGLARTPQMGWNSWNKFKCNVNETLIKATIDTFVALKLNQFGYEYVNVDDCWAGYRDKDGNIHSDPKTFPSGMKMLADYAHSKGVKFGLYSDSGTFTCAGRPGTYGYEKNDANSYASWGIDYLKFDNCFYQKSPKQTYPVMMKALNATGRPILFSMCEWGVQDPASWAPSIGNSWRTTDDIQDNWNSMLLNIILSDSGAYAAGPGGWNDPDMLEVGNGGMNFNQYKAHFSLWCITKAPLIIGCDLTTISKETLTILTNKEAIAVNQDSLGVQGKIVYRNQEYLIWAGPLSGNSYALCVVSTMAMTTTDLYLDFQSLFGHNQFKIRDLWAHKDLGTFKGGYAVKGIPIRGCVFYKLTTV
eukprot:TRINITY_DN13794_c0_g1_i1.p1 TRINITY_DN13794_c0_g1~~TRINITY_DN13794_c0_g1_i1.p1  ORF type:complete len:381 (+),score=97.17 TRINITY_DN13794_c0_g1_i1:77-1219(+)